MKLNTSVSKIANSFTYVVSSEKSYKHARTISAVGADSVISLFTSPATDYGVNNRRIDVSVNITIARIRFTVIVRVVNLTSDKVIRAHWSARRHLLCFAHPSNSARSTIELHRLRSFLESVMGAAIFDFLPNTKPAQHSSLIQDYPLNTYQKHGPKFTCIYHVQTAAVRNTVITFRQSTTLQSNCNFFKTTAANFRCAHKPWLPYSCALALGKSVLKIAFGR